MGWLIVLFFAPLAANLSTGGMVLLVLGGILYTIGGFIYGTKPKWLEFKYMGHHEIFSRFRVIGKPSSLLSVYCYVI